MTDPTRVEPSTADREQTDGEFVRDHGGIVDIGPECFGVADGALLCWRGRNYVPQDAIAAAREEGRQEVRAVVEQLANVLEHRETRETVACWYVAERLRAAVAKPAEGER